MSTETINDVDLLTAQMATVLFTNPFAAPAYLLGLVHNRMCSEIFDGLDNIAMKEMGEFERELSEIFQLPREAYQLLAGKGASL